MSDVFVLLGSNHVTTDFVASILINSCLIVTVATWFTKCATILLNGTLNNLSDSLEKLRLQITTMEGVLEVKKANFWFISLDKPAGFFHIRVNRNAEPQFVLAEVIKKVIKLSQTKLCIFISGLSSYSE